MADRTFPAVLVKDPVLGDITAVTLTPGGAGQITVRVGYTLHTAGGEAFRSGSVEIPGLSAAKRTALLDWLTTNALPAIATAEGM